MSFYLTPTGEKSGAFKAESVFTYCKSNTSLCHNAL